MGSDGLPLPGCGWRPVKVINSLKSYIKYISDNKSIFFKHTQEHTVPTVTHADYLPDVTAPDAVESDYEQEEDDQGPEEEYDDYQEALHQMD